VNARRARLGLFAFFEALLRLSGHIETLRVRSLKG
jgi:hypothetical protein